MSLGLSLHEWDGFSVLKIREDRMGLYVNSDMIEFIEGVDLKDKNVIDGGSNIGLFSLYISRRIGNGFVYAFELQEVINGICENNVELNNVNNVLCHHLAISEKTGELVGHTPINYYEENISSVGVKTEATGVHTTRTIALDDFGIENIGLIKLDLEGHEPKALKGMWSIIDKWKPCLIIELSDGYLGDDVQKIVDEIKSHGYTVKKLSDCNYVFQPI